MNKKLEKVLAVIKDSALTVKGKAIDAGHFVAGKAGDAKDYVVARVRPSAEEKECIEQLNEMGELLKAANTRCDLDDLARDLKDIELTISAVRGRVIKIKGEVR